MGSDGGGSSMTVLSGRFQSTLPAWGATLNQIPIFAHPLISIHAPRMGSDLLVHVTMDIADIQFQSTLPAWGATEVTLRSLSTSNFNPRSPHGERPGPGYQLLRCIHFNPRSPHGERHNTMAGRCRWIHFNPRSPHGERPRKALTQTVMGYFNPRSPHGERLTDSVKAKRPQTFQSTLPAWGATLTDSERYDILKISIHAPRMGSDKKQLRSCKEASYFNPRSPHGERL